jgi:putative ABC transport system permease protein
MFLFALKMLVGEKAKYLSILIALSFSAFIISQQAAIFLGIMRRTYGFVSDTPQPNLWIVDPTVQFIDDIKAMKSTDVFRVRSVREVLWAVPLYKGLLSARLSNGVFQTCILIGLDDPTLIGGPPRMIEGDIHDLRMSDAVIVNRVGAETKLAEQLPDGTIMPLHIGQTMELNDHRVYVVGICDTARTFQSQPVVYTTYTRAMELVPKQRKLLSFILARSQPGVSPEEACQKIRAATGLAAYTRQQLIDLTVNYYIKNTGILINFGVAILLGFVIGVAIAGQTFYNFTIDNLPFFGVFKAMGARNFLLLKMLFIQAIFLSALGWGIGIGATAIFGYCLKNTELSFSLPLSLYFLSGLSILFICLFSALFSGLKVLKTDPSIVFTSA